MGVGVMAGVGDGVVFIVGDIVTCTAGEGAEEVVRACSEQPEIPITKENISENINDLLIVHTPFIVV